MSVDLAVVIVSWNTRDLLLDALATLYSDLNTHGPHVEVWVVDCASADGTVAAVQAQYPQVKLIASETNLGFAGGNNLALQRMGFAKDHAGARSVELATLPHAIYLLNSDTRTRSGATRALYDALFSLPHAGVVGAQLEYGDGSFQHGAFHFPGLIQLWIDLFPVPGRFYDSAINGRYARAQYAGGRPFEVDHTLGATMMLRREVIVETGLFDENYFMYCEEIDWSIRIRRAGWNIYTVPAARVVHLAGQSTSQVRPQSIANLWQSRLRLFEQHYSPLKLRMARAIISVGMRRQIALTRRSMSRGDIPSATGDALIAAYQAVQQL